MGIAVSRFPANVFCHVDCDIPAPPPLCSTRVLAWLSIIDKKSNECPLFKNETLLGFFSPFPSRGLSLAYLRPFPYSTVLTAPPLTPTTSSLRRLPWRERRGFRSLLSFSVMSKNIPSLFPGSPPHFLRIRVGFFTPPNTISRKKDHLSGFDFPFPLFKWPPLLPSFLAKIHCDATLG